MLPTQETLSFMDAHAGDLAELAIFDPKRPSTTGKKAKPLVLTAPAWPFRNRSPSR
jgi:hypothetical protein